MSSSPEGPGAETESVASEESVPGPAGGDERERARLFRERVRRERASLISVILGAVGWVGFLVALRAAPATGRVLLGCVLVAALGAVASAVVADLPRERSRPLGLGAKLGFALGSALLGLLGVAWAFARVLARL